MSPFPPPLSAFVCWCRKDSICLEKVVPQLSQCAKTKHLDVFLWSDFAFGLSVAHRNVALHLFVMTCESEIELQMFPLQVVRQMVPDGVDPLDVAEYVLGQQASRIQDTSFDGECVRSVIVEDGIRSLKTAADNLVEDKLDQQVTLDD